jgi:c-di-GMP-binding flagellar brake protein YcgR
MNPFESNFVSPAEQTFARDRRASRRYEISLKLRWKVLRRKRLLETGTGTTLDFSSAGILFRTDTKLPLDGTLELSIAWPILLHDALPMQLTVAGRIVRVSGRDVAIAITQYEFRTAGAAAHKLH